MRPKLWLHPFLYSPNISLLPDGKPIGLQGPWPPQNLCRQVPRSALASASGRVPTAVLPSSPPHLSPPTPRAQCQSDGGVVLAARLPRGTRNTRPAHAPPEPAGNLKLSKFLPRSDASATGGRTNHLATPHSHKLAGTASTTNRTCFAPAQTRREIQRGNLS